MYANRDAVDASIDVFSRSRFAYVTIKILRVTSIKFSYQHEFTCVGILVV